MAASEGGGADGGGGEMGAGGRYGGGETKAKPSEERHVLEQSAAPVAMHAASLVHTAVATSRTCDRAERRRS